MEKQVDEAWERLKGESKDVLEVVETVRTNIHRGIPVIKIFYKHTDDWNCVVDDIRKPPNCVENILTETDLTLVHVENSGTIDVPVYGPKECAEWLEQILKRQPKRTL